MNAELWIRIAETLLAPPALLLLSAFAGFLLQIRWRWTGSFVIVASLAALFGVSTPIAGRQFLAALEQSPPLTSLPAPEEARRRAGAIVLLGGGRHREAAEYAGDTVNTRSLERLRYAVRLHRHTRLPLLVSGGAGPGEETPEAELMAKVLKAEYGVEPRWLEPRSRTTLENAEYSSRMLREAGIGSAFLVTHAWHMPRALWSFTRYGIEVIPAPTGFVSLDARERGAIAYLPSARGLARTSLAFREWLGLQWYRMRDPESIASSARIPAGVHAETQGKTASREQ